MAQPRRMRSLGVEALEGRQLLTVEFARPFFVAGATADVATVRLNRSDFALGELDPGATRTVTLRTADGTARAGVDYVAVEQSVTFGPGEATKDVAIPLIPNPSNPGERTVLLSIVGDTGETTDAAPLPWALPFPLPTPEPLNQATLTLANRADLTAPKVSEVVVETTRGRVTSVVVKFSEAMDASTFEDPGQYALLDPLRLMRGMRIGPRSLLQPQRLFRGIQQAIVPVSRAVYDPATNSVSLTPARAMRATPGMMVGSPLDLEAIAAGRSPLSRLTDAAGNRLDGDLDGEPDGMLTSGGAVVRVVNVAKPRPRPRGPRG